MGSHDALRGRGEGDIQEGERKSDKTGIFLSSKQAGVGKAQKSRAGGKNDELLCLVKCHSFCNGNFACIS